MKFWTHAESLKFEVEGMYPKLKITYMGDSKFLFIAHWDKLWTYVLILKRRLARLDVYVTSFAIDWCSDEVSSIDSTIYKTDKKCDIKQNNLT